MILIFGVDGLSFRYCVEKGLFIDQGSFFRSDAMITDFMAREPFSGPNWTSIYTGLQPVDHGVIMNGRTMSGPTFADVRSSTWLDGENTASFLMPFTWGLEVVGKSWTVPGWPSPTDLDIAQGIDLPEEFLFDVMDERLGTVWGQMVNATFPPEVLDTLVLILGYHSGFLFRHSNDLRSKDVVAVGTKAVDRVCHAYGGLGDHGVYGIHCWVEQIFKMLVWMYQPDYWVVCSDHGFQDEGGKHDTEGICVYSGSPGVEEEARPVWEVGQMIGEEAGVSLGESVSSCHRLDFDTMKGYRRTQLLGAGATGTGA